MTGPSSPAAEMSTAGPGSEFSLVHVLRRPLRKRQEGRKIAALEIEEGGPGSDAGNKREMEGALANVRQRFPPGPRFIVWTGKGSRGRTLACFLYGIIES